MEVYWMRCVSQYAEHKRGLREHIVAEFATGKSQIVQHGFVAEFRPNTVLAHEKEIARARFRFHGQYQEEDEATPIDPVYGNDGYGSRLSAFDTDDPDLVERWLLWDRLEGLEPGSVKAEIEARLLREQDDAYFVVELAKLAPPWPKYSELRGPNIPERIAKTVSDLGLDPVSVVAFERQEKNRPEVVAALEALSAPVAGEDLVAA